MLNFILSLYLNLFHLDHTDLMIILENRISKSNSENDSSLNTSDQFEDRKIRYIDDDSIDLNKFRTDSMDLADMYATFNQTIHLLNLFAN